MKIVQVNITIESIEKMKSLLIGKNKLFMSRSDLIRYAIRDFLLKRLDILQNKNTIKAYNSSNTGYIKIPVDKNDTIDKNNEYKIYKIIKKLG